MVNAGLRIMNSEFNELQLQFTILNSLFLIHSLFSIQRLWQKRRQRKKA
jgi:hypothetical protein